MMACSSGVGAADQARGQRRLDRVPRRRLLRYDLGRLAGAPAGTARPGSWRRSRWMERAGSDRPERLRHDPGAAFDPISFTWRPIRAPAGDSAASAVSRLYPLPNGHVAFVVNNYEDGLGNGVRVQTYDPATDTWTAGTEPRPDLSYGTSQPAATHGSAVDDTSVAILSFARRECGPHPLTCTTPPPAHGGRSSTSPTRTATGSPTQSSASGTGDSSSSAALRRPTATARAHPRHHRRQHHDHGEHPSPPPRWLRLRHDVDRQRRHQTQRRRTTPRLQPDH